MNHKVDTFEISKVKCYYFIFSFGHLYQNTKKIYYQKFDSFIIVFMQQQLLEKIYQL